MVHARNEYASLKKYELIVEEKERQRQSMVVEMMLLFVKVRVRIARIMTPRKRIDKWPLDVL